MPRRGRILVMAAIVDDETDLSALLDSELPEHPDLVQGQLENGLKYVILPNSVPPKRFEAHLEIHVGSVDEQKDEQGMAHIVEHVTFLGSKKRDGLLGTGGRSNAYTDFHHTVFHVHSPIVNATTGERMLPQVLEVLEEIAFKPQFLGSRIEKERRAVLAEAQMMNTIEYRVDCQLLRHLHEENALGSRFPIGKTDQIKKWEGDKIRAFHKRWYFPANATLYVVGELDQGVEGTKALIEKTFGGVPAGREEVEPCAPVENGNGAATVKQLGPLKARHAVRPPVVHNMGVGPLDQAQDSPCKISIFRHSLLQYFMLSILCKVPVQPTRTLADMRHSFMLRILLSVMQFRMSARYTDCDSNFIAIELDHSDSAREGCAVSTLTITSEPNDWRGAVQVAQQELRRLQRYGVTKSELERYKDVLLRDSAQSAEQSGSVPSIDNLDFVMESLALDHVVMDHRQAHEMLLQVADSITLEETNAISRSLLSFVSDYGSEEAALDAATMAPEEWSRLGATRSTCIVACLPAFMDKSGYSTGGGMPMQRGASMTTGEHVEVSGSLDTVEGSGDLEDNPDDIPEDAVKFEITAEDIQAVLKEESLEVEPMEEIDVPDHLVAPEELDELIATYQPAFVPVDPAGAGPAQPPKDPHTGVTQRKLSNGVAVNYRHTMNEPRSAILRLVAAGGRTCEQPGAGPSGSGSVCIGTRTLSESGSVGAWKREQVELFCISKLVNCVIEASDEMVFMDIHFPVNDGGIEAMFELLNCFVRKPRWEEAAMQRSQQIYLSHYRSLPKSLERATADRLLATMLGDDCRFRDVKPDEIEALTLKGIEAAVMSQLTPSNIEVNIVGDFDEDTLDAHLLRYLGTIPPSDHTHVIPSPDVKFQAPLDPAMFHQAWHLKDSDERAIAIIAGPAPNRWNAISPQMLEAGATPASLAAGEIVPPVAPEAIENTPEAHSAANAIRRAHPLYSSITLMLLTEIINSRLFTTVRDALGLTYDVAFELTVFERIDSGWFFVTVTSTPEKIHEAREASLNVLLNVATQRITPRELQRAKRTLLTRHESDQKDNGYWLSLLTHLQADSVPSKRLECLRDLRAMYEAATINDVYDAYSYLRLDNASVYSCIGTSGKTPPPARPILPPNPSTATSDGNPPLAPDTMFAALASAARNIDFAKAMKSMQNQQKQ